MNTNNKVLELTFTVEGSRSMTLSIPCPKDDLTLETVKEKAALILPVLESSSGHAVTAFKQAKIVIPVRPYWNNEERDCPMSDVPSFSPSIYYL